MKRYASRFLKTVGLFYMAYPASYLLAVALLFDIPARKCVGILLSPFYWGFSLIAAIAGYGLWEMRRWSWYLFLLASVLTVYSDAYLVSSHGETSHKVLAFLLSVLFVAFLIARVAREVRVPYFLPRIRWWESDPRYKVISPTVLTRGDSHELPGEILDLSMGGCFVKLKSELQTDEPIRVRFTLFGVPVDTAGVVVWRTQSTVTHPKGVGVKFDPLDRQHRRAMRAICGRLRKIATLYRTSRYLLNPEEFNRRLRELQLEPLRVGHSGTGREKENTL